MLLAVDIGNSTIGLGLFPEPESDKCAASLKMPTYPLKSPAAYKKIIAKFVRSNTEPLRFKDPSLHNQVEVIISSVVPAANRPFTSASRDLFKIKPLMVSPSLDTGLAFKVRLPEKVGPDRIANAAAAAHLVKGPAAIADFGTATTITVVGRQSVLLGGAIMPGLTLMGKSLKKGTARLPAVGFKACPEALGTDTISAIVSGIMVGTAGAVEGLLKNMEKGLGFRLKLILTGGHAGLMSPLFTRKHKVVHELALQGMRLIYLKHRSTMKMKGCK